MTLSLYDWIDIAGMFLCLCVMVEAEWDEACQMAPLWMQWLRRMCFGSIALLLLNAVLEDNSQFSLLLLVWFGIAKFAINCAALFMRRPKPPKSNGDLVLHTAIRSENAIRGAGVISTRVRRGF